MAERRWDVAVVGAGPAGSATATLFARHGYRVILLERSHFPRPKACAEYMSPGVVQILERLGLSGALAGARSVPGMEIVSPRGARVRLRYHLADRYLAACTLPRLRFDAALVQAAAAAGAEVVEGFVARRPVFEEGAVQGVAGSSEGRERSVRARLTVVADGSRSSLARALGLDAPPRWPVRLGLVAHYEGEPALADGFGQMHVARGGYCGVAPLPDGLSNVSIVVRTDALRAARQPAARYFDRWIAAQPRLADLLRGCRRAGPVRGVGPIGSRSRAAQRPGVLLVGDAAGFFDPFTGEGIYRALRGAELAFAAGQEALERGASLSPYDAMRTRAFRSKEAVTALVQLFVQVPPLMEYALPRLAGRSAPAETLSAVLGDVSEARSFLAPGMMWAALRP